MKTFKKEVECDSCSGTGLYVGFAEHDGAAVVCHKCDGTGKLHLVVDYEEFTGRKEHNEVKRVYETNPGIGISAGTAKDGATLSLQDFGGMSYEEWKEGKKFKAGMEMRKFVCPKWWAQSTGKDFEYDKCTWTSFPRCEHFNNKHICWKDYDKQQRGK